MQMSRKCKKREDTYEHALRLVNDDHVSLRQAVKLTLEIKRLLIDKSTLNRCVLAMRNDQNSARRSPGRSTVLTSEQEKHLAETHGYYSARGVPLVLDEISQFIHDAYGNLTHVRDRFKNGYTGRQWLRNFSSRHEPSFRKPSIQAAERYKATNVDVFTEHMNRFGELIRKYNIDATRLYNLDKTSMSPANDCHGTTRKKSVMPKNVRYRSKGVDFASNFKSSYANGICKCEWRVITTFMDFQR